MIQSIILLVGVLAGVSLFFGLAVALVVVIWAQDVDSAVWLIGNSYYVLVGLMPIALWLALAASHDDAEHQGGYTTLLRSLLTTLQGAVVGSVLGAGPIFLAAVINLPVILADFEIGEFGPAVRDAIVWSHLLLAIGAALASAIPLGLWAYYSGAGREDD